MKAIDVADFSVLIVGVTLLAIELNRGSGEHDAIQCLDRGNISLIEASPTPKVRDSSEPSHLDVYPSPRATPAASKVPPSVESNKGTGGRFAPALDVVRAGASDPAFVDIYLSAFRAAISSEYRPFLDELSVSGQQEARFERVLVDWATRWLELYRSVGAPSASGAADALHIENAALRDARLDELLGPGAAERLKAFKDTVISRDLAEQFAPTAVLLGEPITGEQHRLLLNAIRDSRIYARRADRSWIVPSDLEYSDLLARSRGFLTPVQYSLFEQALTNVRRRPTP